MRIPPEIPIFPVCSLVHFTTRRLKTLLNDFANQPRSWPISARLLCSRELKQEGAKVVKLPRLKLILDRAIALLSAPDAWLAQAVQQPGGCAQQRTGPSSLACAIQVAHLELTGQTAPGNGIPAAFREVIYTVAVRWVI